MNYHITWTVRHDHRQGQARKEEIRHLLERRGKGRERPELGKWRKREKRERKNTDVRETMNLHLKQ